MIRTQVYLSADELALLDRAAQTSGASRSELIRRAVKRVYGEAAASERLAVLMRTAGSWQDRDFTGAEYVDRMRDDLTERLRQLNLE